MQQDDKTIGVLSTRARMQRNLFAVVSMLVGGFGVAAIVVAMNAHVRPPPIRRIGMTMSMSARALLNGLPRN